MAVLEIPLVWCYIQSSVRNVTQRHSGICRLLLWNLIFFFFFFVRCHFMFVLWPGRQRRWTISQWSVQRNATLDGEWLACDDWHSDACDAFLKGPLQVFSVWHSWKWTVYINKPLTFCLTKLSSWSSKEEEKIVEEIDLPNCDGTCAHTSRVRIRSFPVILCIELDGKPKSFLQVLISWRNAHGPPFRIAQVLSQSPWLLMSFFASHLQVCSLVSDRPVEHG